MTTRIKRGLSNKMQVMAKVCWCYDAIFMSQVILQVQKRLFTDDHFLKSKISSYENPFEAIETVKRKLTFEQLQEFHKTCFGNFFNMKAFIHQGHMFQLFGLKVMECDNDEVLKFNLRRIGVGFID